MPLSVPAAGAVRGRRRNGIRRSRAKIDSRIEARRFTGDAGGQIQRVHGLVLRTVAERDAPQARIR